MDSSEEFWNFRKVLKLASWSKIRDFRTTLIPPYQFYPSVSNPIGVTVNYIDHIVNILKRIITHSIQSIEEPQSYPIHFMVKHGVDESEVTVCLILDLKQVRDSLNFLLFMVSPLELKDYEGNITQSIQYSNSRFSKQPIALLPQKENIESVTLLMNSLNPQIDELVSTAFENESGHVNIEIKGLNV